MAVVSGTYDANHDGYENEPRRPSVLKYLTASFHPHYATVLQLSLLFLRTIWTKNITFFLFKFTQYECVNTHTEAMGTYDNKIMSSHFLYFLRTIFELECEGPFTHLSSWLQPTKTRPVFKPLAKGTTGQTQVYERALTISTRKITLLEAFFGAKSNHPALPCFDIVRSLYCEARMPIPRII